ncbi:hypothetical protein GCM10025777_12000 [Membranihabitans marinus]
MTKAIVATLFLSFVQIFVATVVKNLDQGRKTKYIHKSRSSLDLLEGVLRFKYLAFSMMLDN